MRTESVLNEIKWYNDEISSIKDKIENWLRELGHKVISTQTEITNSEETSGDYKTHQFDYRIDDSINITLVPYGIWIIGAKGRIDIKGPSGSEKLLYFFAEGPGSTTEINVIEKSSHKYFNNIDEDSWYWYDDSSCRKAMKFSKETFQIILERIL